MDMGGEAIRAALERQSVEFGALDPSGQYGVYVGNIKLGPRARQVEPGYIDSVARCKLERAPKTMESNRVMQHPSGRDTSLMTHGVLPEGEFRPAKPNSTTAFKLLTQYNDNPEGVLVKEGLRWMKPKAGRSYGGAPRIKKTLRRVYIRDPLGGWKPFIRGFIPGTKTPIPVPGGGPVPVGTGNGAMDIDPITGKKRVPPGPIISYSGDNRPTGLMDVPHYPQWQMAPPRDDGTADIYFKGSPNPVGSYNTLTDKFTWTKMGEQLMATYRQKERTEFTRTVKMYNNVPVAKPIQPPNKMRKQNTDLRR